MFPSPMALPMLLVVPLYPPSRCWHCMCTICRVYDKVNLQGGESNLRTVISSTVHCLSWKCCHHCFTCIHRLSSLAIANPTVSVLTCSIRQCRQFTIVDHRNVWRTAHWSFFRGLMAQLVVFPSISTEVVCSIPTDMQDATPSSIPRYEFKWPA